MRLSIPGTVLALLLPGAAAAQQQRLPIPVPRDLVIPNYDGVLVGQIQGLEGTAYIARAADSAANFYNPAGLVLGRKSSINASSSGYNLIRVSSSSAGRSISSTRLDGAPGFVGLVIGSPFFSGDDLRCGFSVIRTVSWNPGAFDQSYQPDSSSRVSYSSDPGFSSTAVNLAIGWRAAGPVRLGGGVGVVYTSYASVGTLSGILPVDGTPTHSIASTRFKMGLFHLVGTLGAQWDIAKEVTVGALVRSPGLRIARSSRVTYESSIGLDSGETLSFFQDSGQFDYKQPLEAAAGAALRISPALEFEVDARFHAAVATYDFYRSDAPVQVRTQVPGGSPETSTQPFPVIQNSARSVVNVAAGGRVRLSDLLTLHAGFFTSLSPVDDPRLSRFRKADIFGATGGAALAFEHFSLALGLAYQWGTSEPVIETDLPQAYALSLDLSSVTVLYAIGYQF